jgi:hypothetical protein
VPLPLTPPSILPAGAVRAIDRIQAKQAKSICVLQRPAGVDEVGVATGGGWYTFAVADCQVNPPSGGSETQIAGRVGPDADYVVRLPRWADVRGEDRILVLDRARSVIGSLQVIYVARLQTSGLRTTAIAKARK